MTVLYRILRAIDDTVFDRVLQPVLDRTGWNPARLAPLMLGASFAAFLARVLLLQGNGQLAEHLFDAGVPVIASANLYRLYLGRFSADMAFVFLAVALSIVGFYIGACEPPRPPRRRVPSSILGLRTAAPPRA